MEIEEFKDRISANPNRRKLKIISQQSDEILADIEYAEVATQDGTPLNAENLNKMRSAINEFSALKDAVYNSETNTFTLNGTIVITGTLVI